jgi:hypothetical protein
VSGSHGRSVSARTTSRPTQQSQARTELNVAIGYVDRAARRLADEPGTNGRPTPWSA